jgi:hypothetical protein
MYTVAQLIEELNQIPDKELPVVVHCDVTETQGLLQSIRLIRGQEECPYDKGDDIFASTGAKDNQIFIFLTHEGVAEKL